MDEHQGAGRRAALKGGAAVSSPTLSGYVTWSDIRSLLIKLGGNLTACLTGGSVSSSAGAAILMLTMP